MKHFKPLSISKSLSRSPKKLAQLASHIYSHQEAHSALTNPVTSISGLSSPNLAALYTKPFTPPSINPDSGLPSKFAIFRVECNYKAQQYLGLGFPIPLDHLINYWDEDTHSGDIAECMGDWVDYTMATKVWKDKQLNKQTNTGDK